MLTLCRAHLGLFDMQAQGVGGAGEYMSNAMLQGEMWEQVEEVLEPPQQVSVLMEFAELLHKHDLQVCLECVLSVF